MSADKSELLTTVSHELRTPLTSILAFADLLTRNSTGNLLGKQQRHLQIIQQSGRRLAELIDDLLGLTNIERGQIELKPVRFGVEEMFTDVADSFGPILQEKNQALNVMIEDSSIEMFADQIRLTQVVSNLLTNASKYSAEGTEVNISVEADDDEVVVKVTDQGIGIDSGDILGVFGAFFRADNEGTRAQSGTGIGLYFCRMILDHHHGEISAESEVGSGTTMIVRIPREYESDSGLTAWDEKSLVA